MIVITQNSTLVFFHLLAPETFVATSIDSTFR